MQILLVFIRFYTILCVFNVWTCILGVWTVFWMSGLVFNVGYMHFYVFICVFDAFMSLVWPPSVPQALFFRHTNAFPDFLTVSILEIPRICWISVYMDLGTCLERRAPKNHAFWRYWDLQISHHDPIGDQNDDWSETHPMPASGANPLPTSTIWLAASRNRQPLETFTIYR